MDKTYLGDEPLIELKTVICFFVLGFEFLVLRGITKGFTLAY
jgi:hypothetical protein